MYSLDFIFLCLVQIFPFTIILADSFFLCYIKCLTLTFIICFPALVARVLELEASNNLITGILLGLI